MRPMYQEPQIVAATRHRGFEVPVEADPFPAEDGTGTAVPSQSPTGDVRVKNAPHTIDLDRPISDEEAATVRWLLENGCDERPLHLLLASVSGLRVVSRCGCGCASVDFVPVGQQWPHAPIAEAQGKTSRGLDCGLILWGTEHSITGLEVYEYEPPSDEFLPRIDSLRTWQDFTPQSVHSHKYQARWTARLSVRFLIPLAALVAGLTYGHFTSEQPPKTITITPAPGALPAGPWSVVQGENEGRILFARVNQGLLPVKGSPALQHRVDVIVPLRSPRDDGLPEGFEMAALNRVEDALCERVEDQETTVLAVVVTTAGRREFVFYTSEPTRVTNTVESLASELFPYEVSCTVEHDPKWVLFESLED